MAAPVQRIQPVKLPTLPASITPENRYWRSFKAAPLINSHSAVTHVSFSPSQPHDVVSSTGSRVQIFSVKSRTLSKTISRFKDNAYSAEVRSDGKVLVAGDATGLIQIFDLGSRAILRSFDQHKQPVQATRFSPVSLTTLLSASDDTTVRVWDVPSQEPTSTFLGHTDYVRAAAFLPGSSGTVISGSYDGKVKLWDPRIPTTGNGGGCVMTFTHAHAVESILPMTGGTTILSSADNCVNILDIVAAKALRQLSNHQKTVTCLAAASNGRILSGGLDGHVKIYETREWKVVHGIKYQQPILSLGVSPDDKNLVVGMSNGLLSIHTRTTGPKQLDTMTQIGLLADMGMEKADKIAKKKEKSNNYARKIRGMDYKGGNEDVIIKDAVKQKQPTRWEKLVREGKYKAALDEVLNGKYPPLAVLTLLTSLKHSSALRAAFQNRDEKSLQPIFKWLTKYMADPRFADLIMDVTFLLLGQSPQVDKLVERMYQRVQSEVEKGMRAAEANGMLSILLAGSA